MKTALRYITWVFGEGELIISYNPKTQIWNANHKSLEGLAFGKPSVKSAKLALNYAIKNQIV